MSTEIVTTADEDVTTENILQEFSTPSTTWLDESEIIQTTALGEEFSTTESVNNTSIADNQQFQSESQLTLTVFEAFIIIEIVMTALELIISILAACKVERWRRNYRNQMLMQLSLVRFIKRIFALVGFLAYEKHTVTDSLPLTAMLISARIYIDFVIVILVFFFIRHMYDSLILVLVKISQNNLAKVSTCAWLLPLPMSAVGTTLIVLDILNEKWVNLIICSIFRWPLMFLGTMLYISILYRVLRDKTRRFARSLTVITFLLCLVINLYLFSKDVIKLWCIQSFSTKLASDILGFLLNILILCLYIVLITLNFQSKPKYANNLPK